MGGGGLSPETSPVEDISDVSGELCTMTRLSKTWGSVRASPPHQPVIGSYITYRRFSPFSLCSFNRTVFLRLSLTMGVPLPKRNSYLNYSCSVVLLKRVPTKPSHLINALELLTSNTVSFVHCQTSSAPLSVRNVQIRKHLTTSFLTFDLISVYYCASWVSEAGTSRRQDSRERLA